jgi:pimeloyl-ACP methyl ester carboxylesterase
MQAAISRSKPRLCLASLAVLLLPWCLFAQQPVVNPAIIKTPSPGLIVVGFAGGFIKRNSAYHGEIALALHLRDQYSNSIHSEIFENHHGNAAHREILHLIAAQQIPRNEARVILYGHSWGASEAVDVARQLQHDGIPVLLLAEVDGVRKHNHNDGRIPANVAQAINFYQTEGLLHGRNTIDAADPSATRILGNIQLSYKDDDVATPGYPWLARAFTRRHIEIENDPRVWNRIQSMILAQRSPLERSKDLTAALLR